MNNYRNARECLSAITAKYKSFDTYTDEGVVRAIGTTGLNSCWFETKFARPDRFRFQFSTPHPYRPLRHVVTKTIIGSDGHTSYFFSEHPRAGQKIEIEENLILALAGATGISQGTAHTIGSLLIEGVGGFSLPMLKRPRFRQARPFEGGWCGRISGIHPRGGRFTIWYGLHDLVLRKVVRHKFKQEEVRSNIRINKEVENAVFNVPQLQT